MKPASPTSACGSEPHAAFRTTLWSQVRSAGRSDAPEASQALESLCRVYWGPIFAFLRRWGFDCSQAKDLTQGFFAYVLEEGLLQQASADRGRFRSFLLGTLKCFVSNQRTRERALKRGGGARMLSLDAGELEGAEPVTHATPEQSFDRKWAMTVLSEAMNRLETEYRRAGSHQNFDLLRPFLIGETDESAVHLAGQLNRSEGAARVFIFRLRNRFRRHIRAVIADTVSDPAQVEEELRDLQDVLRGD